MSTSLTGRCLCGAVRYRCGALLTPATLCHCESCRRAAGAHAVAWLTVRYDSLEFFAGTPVIYESSPGVRRSFCGRCGTPLSYWSAKRADEIDLTIASLDAPDAIAPVDHVWMSDALSWDRPGEGRPEHPRGREEEPD
jgi:hypothetical protein